MDEQKPERKYHCFACGEPCGKNDIEYLPRGGIVHSCGCAESSKAMGECEREAYDDEIAEVNDRYFGRSY